ncbi:hypothetical protein Tco_0109066 [Tanacetum coccineum]
MITKSAMPYAATMINIPRSKQYCDISFHFIKEQVENIVVELYLVNTEYQLADIFTMPLVEKELNFLSTSWECEISGLYTSRLLDAASNKVLNLLKKGLLKVETMPKSAWTEKDQIDNFLKEIRFNTSAGNPVKEILLKLNLPDHRMLKVRGEVIIDFRLELVPLS